MDRPKPFLIALIALYGVLAVLVAIDYPRLPDRLATHFGVSGAPDGWASRPAYAALTLIGAAFTALVAAGALSIARLLPDSMINLPRKEYWLADGRRERTMDRLASLGLCIACLSVALFIGLHIMVARANAGNPVRLPPTAALGLMAGFVVGLAAVISVAFLGFGRTDS